MKDVFEPMAGDIALLVPVEKHWRVLDLTDPGRAVAIAPWARHTVHVRWSSEGASILEDGRPAQAREHPEPFDMVVADHRLPFRRCAFDLVVLAQSSPWSLADVRRFLRVGGWLVWLTGPPIERGGPGEARGLLGAIQAVSGQIRARLTLEKDWRQALAVQHLTYRRAYVHFREYAWGFLPYDGVGVQQYYLDAIQEEGTGWARGRARIARMLGRLGVYRYVASTYVVVARAGVPR